MRYKWILAILIILLMAVGCGQKEETAGTVPEETGESVSEETVDNAEDGEEEPVENSEEQEIPLEETAAPEETDPAGEDVSAEVAETSQDNVTITPDDSEVEEKVAAEPVTDAGTEEEVLTTEETEETTVSEITVEEVRAMWLSYLDLLPVFNNGQGTEEAYRNYMTEVLADMKSFGLNTLIYQVRPFGDALYASDLFPSSYIMTGVEGAPMAFDPFGIAVTMAHEENIRVEAWINPYRIRTSKSTVPLSEGNLALTWYEDGSGRVLKSPEGTMVYSPASDDVQDRIVAGVEEIISKYPVDGIHFDDYFYPTTETSFDELPYLNFLHDNDAMTQDEWRRSNVNELVSKVYSTVKAADPDVVFGISPNGDIDANLQYHYADVVLWMSEEGYVDYLMPQIYFGFNHGRLPFEQVLNQWHYLDEGSIELIPAIAVYKVGKEDQWAGDAGKNEWIDNVGIIADMIAAVMDQPSYRGYALYRYGSLFQPSEELMLRIENEIEAVKLLDE